MKKNSKNKRPVCLIILDGWGLSDNQEGNAIAIADTPNVDKYFKVYPHTRLDASGEAVGLPEGQMGNSEVGHLNIGAGRIVYQEFTRINKSIESGEFYDNPVLDKAFSRVDGKNKNLHLIGLVSDGGVHSHIDHLKALVDMARIKNIKNLYIHTFLDGRDVPPRSAVVYLEELDKYLREKSTGRIATISGRYYAMDRDNRWDRTKKAYDALVYRKGEKFKSAVELVKNSYKNGINDEFVIPGVVDTGNNDNAGISNGDSVIFFNFRPDRARQLTRAFIISEFKNFDRGENPPDVFFTSMTLYDKNFDIPVAFSPQKIVNTLGEVLSDSRIRQLRIAETEKYAHVTFFFNGGIEKPYPGEDRILIPSPSVPTYDKKPEMSAYEVTDKLIQKIRENIYDFIVLNYANPDMVGHTGVLDAAVKAVEAVDSCAGRVVDEITGKGGIAIVTADHGNAEEMISPENHEIVTAHSTSQVPFIICNKEYNIRDEERNYRLSDIAPAILKILDIDKPPQMKGASII
jgi:2,3-bisphosphoglycerate-independent phosphoglycerate mutase